MRLYIFIVLCLLSDSVIAQSADVVYYTNKSREIGLNTTAFFQNYINIGDVERKVNVKGISYKGIRQNRNGFRAAFGASFSDENGPDFFFLAMGFERRLKGFKNFVPFWGFDVFANTSDFRNQPNSNIGRGFGFGPLFGLNYDINERISLGTEAALYATIDGFSADLDFVPPIDLFLYVKFPKKVIRKRNIRYF